MNHRSLIKEIYRNVGKGRKHAHAVITRSVVIRPQRNKWSCGPMALRHALLGYGINIDDRRLAKLAGTTRAGTSEVSLAKATRKLRCGLRLNMPPCPRTAKRAKELVKSSLKKKQPVILCIDKWTHWVAILQHTSRGFLMLDSSRPGPVIKLISMKNLILRMRLKYKHAYRKYFLEDKRPLYYVWTLAMNKHCTKKRK